MQLVKEKPTLFNVTGSILKYKIRINIAFRIVIRTRIKNQFGK